MFYDVLIYKLYEVFSPSWSKSGHYFYQYATKLILTPTESTRKEFYFLKDKKISNQSESSVVIGLMTLCSPACSSDIMIIMLLFLHWSSIQTETFRRITAMLWVILNRKWYFKLKVFWEWDIYLSLFIKLRFTLKESTFQDEFEILQHGKHQIKWLKTTWSTSLAEWKCISLM